MSKRRLFLLFLLVVACLAVPVRAPAAAITLNLLSEPSETYIPGLLPILDLQIGARAIPSVG